MEQQVAFGAATTAGAPWYVMLAIILMPGAVAVAMTVLLVRYLRVFARDEGQSLSKRQTFKLTLGWGAFCGVGAQAGLQKLVNYLTGTPIMWELMIPAVMFTGLASMLAYEAVRVFCAYRARKNNGRIWRHLFNWISVKDAMPQDDDNAFADTDSGLTRMVNDYEKTKILSPEERSEITD